MQIVYKIILTLVVICGLALQSCESLVDEINANPNKITIDDVDAKLFLTGAMLANTIAQSGHMNRISNLWSGQLVGFSSLYSNIYGYSISTAEAATTWSRIYVGVLPNVRHIREAIPNDKLMVGISKVLEAHAIGTAASLFGDIPYSQVNDFDVADPVFDGQISVFNSVNSLLDEAIEDLATANSRTLDQDIHFEGDANKWREVAYTLKARYLLQMKDYANAYAAAQNGISSADASMKHIPRGDASITSGDKNLFYEILEGSRAGDIGSGDSYLMQMLDAGSSVSRSHTKTNEFARFHYYTIDESGGSPNKGIIEQYEPQNMVTYQENLLILAEAGARTQGMNTGLGHLNDLRAWLNTGAFLNDNFKDSTYLYDPFESGDFESGGIENADGIDATRALLREIIEERYVSGFGMFTAFNDARRLRKDDSDIAVPFPLNPGSASQHPERMPYSDDELTTNENAPADDPGIYTTTPVNQ